MPNSKAYSIELSTSAFKSLQMISRSQPKTYRRLESAIDDRKTSPYAGKRLAGPLAEFFSLRVGDYRVLYAVIETKVLVHVIDVGHRREIYR